MHGDLRREALRQRLSGAARAQVLPRPTGRPERRAGSGESGKFRIQKVCGREVLERCGPLQGGAQEDCAFSRIFDSYSGKHKS